MILIWFVTFEDCDNWENIKEEKLIWFCSKSPLSLCLDIRSTKKQIQETGESEFSFFLVLFASVWRFVTILLICGTFWTFYHFWTILWQGPVFGVAHKQPGGGGHQQRQGESKAAKKNPKIWFPLSSKRFLWKRYRPTSPSWRAASLRTNLNVSLILFIKKLECEFNSF